MTFKFVLVLAFVAATSAGYIPTKKFYTAASVSLHDAPGNLAHEEFDSHPQYKYSYGVEDKLTGDSKSQVEERDGDVVRGEYSLIDADGYKRIVKYTADDLNGFNAVVEREPPFKTVARYTAPTIVEAVAPVSYSDAPTVVNTVALNAPYALPLAHYSTDSVVKSVAPVAYYPGTVQYTSYDAPTYAYQQ